MCRGRERYFSTYTSSFPNADCASDRASENDQQLLRIMGNAHALPAAAGHRLDNDRESNLARQQRFLRSSTGPGVPGIMGTPTPAIALRARRLVAHHPDLLGGRADELDVGRGARLGELRVLGEKPVAGVNGISAGDLGGGDDARDLQVRLLGGRGADADIIVRKAHMQRFPVGLGVDRDRLDAEFAARANDATRFPRGSRPVPS